MFVRVFLRREKFACSFLPWKKVNNEFACNFVFKMESRLRYHWKCYRSALGRQLYHEHIYLSYKKHSVKILKALKTCLTRDVHPFLFFKKVKETVLEHRCVDIREITEYINISYRSTQYNLVNVLGTSCTTTWVPYLLYKYEVEIGIPKMKSLNRKNQNSLKVL